MGILLFTLSLFLNIFTTHNTNSVEAIVAHNSDEISSSNPILLDSVQVNRFLLCSKISEKEPVDSLDVSSIQAQDIQKIWAFTELSYYGPNTNLVFQWYLNGNLYLEYPVQIESSPNWRTYSYVTARVGNWLLKLESAETGEVLDKIEFVIKDGN